MGALGRRATGVLVAAAVALCATGCGRAPDLTTTAATTTAPSVVSTIAGGTEVLGGAAPGAAGGEASDASTGSSPVAATPIAACEKAQFAAHAGLGVGAFHQYLWQPYRQGAFDPNAAGRQEAVAKAALGATQTLREVTAALRDVEGCPDTRALTAAVRAGLAAIGRAATALATGAVDASLLTAIDDQLAAVHRQAAAVGIAVPDQAPLTQLVTSGR